jgi:succinyl-diaminopimelate desuccinylase
MKDLLGKLIRADSELSRGEFGAAEVLEGEFRRNGLDCRLDEWGDGRANVLLRVRSSGERGALLIVGHLDVVPPGEAKWQDDPFSGIERDGKIWGRGATDMKGGLAAMARAIIDIAAGGEELKGDIIFAATAGEESDSCGVKRLMSENAKEFGEIAGILIPEPTDFEVVSAHRGMLWLEVATAGKTAHGSCPDEGVNAIESMRRFLDELDAWRDEGLADGCSMSVNTMSAGKAINVVPDGCSVGIDIRSGAGQEHGAIVRDIEGIIAKLSKGDADFKAEVRIDRDVGPLETDPECEFVRDFCDCVGADQTKAVGYCTDGSFLAGLGAPILIFGPGKPEQCHKPDEFIEIADLEKGAKVFKAIIRKFLT